MNVCVYVCVCKVGVFLRGVTDKFVLPNLVNFVIAPLDQRVDVFVHTEPLETHTDSNATEFVKIQVCWLQCVAVCCSMWQCVAVCCSVLQCVAVCGSALQ